MTDEWDKLWDKVKIIVDSPVIIPSTWKQDELIKLLPKIKVGADRLQDKVRYYDEIISENQETIKSLRKKLGEIKKINNILSEHHAIDFWKRELDAEDLLRHINNKLDEILGVE